MKIDTMLLFPTLFSEMMGEEKGYSTNVKSTGLDQTTKTQIPALPFTGFVNTDFVRSPLQALVLHT